MQIIADTSGKVPGIPNMITFLHDIFPSSPFVFSLYEGEGVVFSILLAIILIAFFTFGTRNKELIPSGLQNFLEWITEILNHLIVGITGEDGKVYFPFLATLFVYILSMNLFGIIPFMKSPSSDLNTTIALAICVFTLVQFLNIRNMGIFGFLYHMAGSPKGTAGWLLSPLLFPVELLTQLSRPVTLSLRLFGNILGEKILVAVFAIFGIQFATSYHIPVGIPLQVPFILFAILTSFMQALIFTLLSTIYIVLSNPHLEEKHH